MNKLQKIKNSIRKFVTSPRFSSLALMLLVGTVACLAQNTAGNYEAGTSALTTVTEENAFRELEFDLKSMMFNGLFNRNN